MDLEKIINKYHYDKKFAEKLIKTYHELVNYMGEFYEPIIYEALLNTEIIITDNIYDSLLSNNMYEEDDNSKLTKQDYQTSAGISVSKPYLSFDGTSFKIDGVKRLIILSSFNELEPFFATLIHELGHLIKSYYNSYVIDQDNLIIYSGLIKKVYKLEYKENRVKTTLVSEQGLGLEEGLNKLLEISIGKKLIAPDFNPPGTQVVATVAEVLLKNEDLKSLIISSQMTSKRDKFLLSFNEYFNGNFYENFESILDKLYRLSLEQIHAVSNPLRLKAITNEINEVITNELNPLMTKMGENRQAKKDL